MVGVILSLSAAGMIEYSMSAVDLLNLTDEGHDYMVSGSPEAQTYAAVPDQGITKDALLQELGVIGPIGFSQAMRAKWIRLGENFMHFPTFFLTFLS
jgi:phenylalanyl-tRNA synthetase alpha chain